MKNNRHQTAMPQENTEQIRYAIMTGIVLYVIALTLPERQNILKMGA